MGWASSEDLQERLTHRLHQAKYVSKVITIGENRSIMITNGDVFRTLGTCCFCFW